MTKIIKPNLRGHQTDMLRRARENEAVRQHFRELLNSPGFDRLQFSVYVGISDCDLRVWLNDNSDFGIKDPKIGRLARVRRGIYDYMQGHLQVDPARMVLERHVEAIRELFKLHRIQITTVAALLNMCPVKLEGYLRRARLTIFPVEARRLDNLYDLMRENYAYTPDRLSAPPVRRVPAVAGRLPGLGRTPRAQAEHPAIAGWVLDRGAAVVPPELRPPTDGPGPIEEGGVQRPPPADLQSP